MYDKADILTRLANGEDAQTIADEIADVLNSALSEHLANQEKAKKASQKGKDAKIIMDMVLDFIQENYPDLYDPTYGEMTEQDLVKMCDEMADEARKFKKTLENVNNILDDLLEVFQKPEEKKVCKCEDKRTDPIEEFLAKYVNN